ncbi:hypothetical protein DM02DRAFT_376999 [Periconia macrospinosa]|uniref:Uncharacterized protein n=1 Tax=Periconia macrospinosa TaxID=97972 RepID=A0A2V1D175_9PLEO|nr:hypothetical protein DM02DRAFT_376999 [Periconia macrospinosa]
MRTALEIEACASASGLSVTGATPSLQVHTKMESPAHFNDSAVVRSNDQRLLTRALQSLGP